MSAGEVAIQIGRALLHTQIRTNIRDAINAVVDALGLPRDPEFDRRVDAILRGLE